MQLLFNQLSNEIDRAGRFLFICHRNPDPDTVGSALALGNFIEAAGKTASYFCVDKIPDNFLFLKNANKFSRDISVLSKDYDVVIFVDCAESSRCGVENIMQYKKQRWVSIDHHISREDFTDILIRNAEAAATTEIIYNFFNHAGTVIDPGTATALLSGILIDTNFLSNAAATDGSIKIAGELSALGADYREVLRAFHCNKNMAVLQLWGLAFARLKYNNEKGTATTAIFQNEMSAGGSDFEDALSGLPGFLNAVLKTDIIVVFEERVNSVRGSFRTSKEDINVAKLAEAYGGGGHAKAAGFTCPGKLVEWENEWRVERAG